MKRISMFWKLTSHKCETTYGGCASLTFLSCPSPNQLLALVAVLKWLCSCTCDASSVCWHTGIYGMKQPLWTSVSISLSVIPCQSYQRYLVLKTTQFTRTTTIMNSPELFRSTNVIFVVFSVFLWLFWWEHLQSLLWDSCKTWGSQEAQDLSFTAVAHCVTGCSSKLHWCHHLKKILC